MKSIVAGVASACGLVVCGLALAQNGFRAVRIEGEGYFRLLRDGRAVYAKSVDLRVQGGELRDSSGASLLPTIRVSDTTFIVDESGWVVAGSSKVARILLAKLAVGPEADGKYLVSRERPELGYAGAGGFGKVVIDSAISTGRPPADPKPLIEARSKPSNSGGSVKIALDSKATVSGSQFTLGEISEIRGQGAERLQAISLGNSPVHGVPLIYTRERILAKVAMAGFGKEQVDLSMGNSTEIRREAQTVTREQLLTKAREAVWAKTGLKGDLESTDRLVPLEVPLGSLEIGTESISLSDGFATVTLGVRVDGKRFLGRTLRLSGAILESAIQAGSNVTVRFVSSGLAVELPGRARTGGAIGQSIDVAVSIENAQPTVHQATVVAKGVVEVKL